MITVDKIGQIRRAFFERHLPIKEIVRTLSVSRATVRKVIRGTAVSICRGSEPPSRRPSPARSARDCIVRWPGPPSVFANQFNERSGGILNRAQYPSDVIALVVFWRLRYKLSLRDLPEMFLIRGIEFSYEAVRDWEAKLTPSLIDNLRRRRKGRIGQSWYVDETYVKVERPLVLPLSRD